MCSTEIPAAFFLLWRLKGKLRMRQTCGFTPHNQVGLSLDALWKNGIWVGLPIQSTLFDTTIMASPAKRPLLGSFPDAADQQMLDDFNKRYGNVRVAPVVIIVPAYNEAETIKSVLATLPWNCEPAPGNILNTSVLVMVDGATDRTLDVVLDFAAQEPRTGPQIFVCASAGNRGQGAALRVGYRIGKAREASYIVTFDADGQYEINELSLLLEPLVAGKADFVTGSRILSRQETTDAVRRLGTYVFAWLVSVLTGKKITDTSFGFRAMRAELVESVTLRQPQYQSSELLVGLLCRGFRVVELPMTMRKRGHGKSKKGNNLVYGFRYARVVLGTWLRERNQRGKTPGSEGETCR